MSPFGLPCGRFTRISLAFNTPLTRQGYKTGEALESMESFFPGENEVMRRLAFLLVLALLVGTASAQQLNAAGATFPYPIYSKWFSEYQKAHGNVQINYQSIGSG